MQEVDHQHSWSVTVWCGIINGYLTGPHFFEGHVTQHTYLQLLRGELPLFLENVDLHTRARMWLQQDGGIVRDFLNERFNIRWIGRRGPVAWAPRSPDLTSPDFYLWGFLKNTVYRTAQLQELT